MRSSDSWPVNDSERLAVLRSLGILDTGPEPVFDDIVEAAAALCDTPIALVSLVDAERQWFKARVGLPIQETPVAQAVCAYVLDTPDILIIPDLAADARTRDNPLVTAEGGIRFYAGVPIVVGGKTLGSLCVIDGAPRPDGLDARQQSVLRALGRQVANVIVLRERVIQRETALISTHEVRRELAAQAAGVEAARIGTFDLDIAGDTLRISDEMREIYGLDADAEVTAAGLEALIIAEDQGVQSNVTTRAAGTAVLDVVYRIRRPSDGEIRSISRRGAFRYDAAGRPTHMFGAVQDVTGSVMLNQELNHRLKNMLAMVMALVTQTLKGVAERGAVHALQDRLTALGVAHDALVQQNWVAAPVRDVATGVIGLLGQAGRVRVSGPLLTLGAKATLGFSLLLHELTTNAVKYGALSCDDGMVALDWRVEDGAEPRLIVSWVESGGPAVTLPQSSGFGSRLIRLGLIGRGGATLDYDPGGLAARFTAPLREAQHA